MDGSNGDMRSTIAAIAFKRGCHGVREGNLGGCDLWDCGSAFMEYLLHAKHHSACYFATIWRIWLSIKAKQFHMRLSHAISSSTKRK